MASIIRRIARKVVGDEIPRQGGFPGASNSFPTWITSEDELRDPPRRLIELSLDVILVALNEISLEEFTKLPNCPEYLPIWPGEHYRLLGAFIKVLAPKMVVEIGTDTGISALVIKKYLPAGGKVITYDLRPWKTVEEHVLTEQDFADGRLEQRIVDLADPAEFEANRSVMEQCSFFFIDGPKNIQFEKAFVKNLTTVKFPSPPILLFDDTRLSAMVKYWRELPYPRLDLTSFGHWSGTGLVELVV